MTQEITKLFSLSGKTALVIGAMGRLGPVWFEALLAAGEKVVGLDIPDAKVSSICAELRAHDISDRLQLLEADVHDRVSLEMASDCCIRALGEVSILANSAGIDQPQGPAASYSASDNPVRQFDEVVEVNSISDFQTIQTFGDVMCERGEGAINNIGLLYAGVSPDARFYDHLDCDPPFLKPPAYGASKAALVNLTKYLSTHWVPYGIWMNSLFVWWCAGQAR